jgi:hypothetical protein
MTIRHRRSTEPLTEVRGPVRTGSALYRLLELAARSVARRLRAGALGGNPCELSRNSGPPRTDSGGN